MHLIAIIPRRDHIHLEIGCDHRIVDVKLENGKIVNMDYVDEPVQDFVKEKVLPYLKYWIGWNRFLRKYDGLI